MHENLIERLQFNADVCAPGHESLQRLLREAANALEGAEGHRQGVAEDFGVVMTSLREGKTLSNVKHYRSNPPPPAPKPPPPPKKKSGGSDNG